MDLLDILLKVVLPLVGIALLSLLVKKLIPDTPLTGSGCGGG